MDTFNIRRQNQTIEVVAKITDSMVQEYGCRLKYEKESGRLNLVGEDFCEEIVKEVLTDLLND